MAFVTDKEILKPGLIIFRRADVQHCNWYCRIKLPKADRYKTFSLKTSDIGAARDKAFDHDADIRAMLKHDIPVFNRPFREVAQEYLAIQVARSKRGELSQDRPKKMRAVIELALEQYIGSTQIHLVGDELWGSYPAWRRENGQGTIPRNGVRRVSEELAQKFADHKAAVHIRKQKNRGIKRPKVKTYPLVYDVPYISDSTIRFEMAIFGAIMQYAIKKRYVPASQRFDERPKLKTMRRDEFSVEEYRALHSRAREWVKAAVNPQSAWYRAVTYNFILIMCNTGMRPSEARHRAFQRQAGARSFGVVRAGQGQVAPAHRIHECG